MPTFKNTSDQIFIDGNIVVKPGQTITADRLDRIEQLTNQYGWQFKRLETQEAEPAPEAEPNVEPDAPQVETASEAVEEQPSVDTEPQPEPSPPPAPSKKRGK